MSWDYLLADLELFQRELSSFVPAKVFDAHAHLYDLKHFQGEIQPLLADGPQVAGLQAFSECIQQIMPNREVTGLFFAFPAKDLDIAAANAFVADEVRKSPGSRGQMLIEPSMDPEFIRQTVRRDGFVGLKCYHVYATEQPTFEAAIPSYLPEEHIRIAHEEGLAVTLHMVRSRALADPVNQEVIRSYSTRYPNARLILAHAARGFNPHHTIAGINSLAGLPNVWFDTSAVTDCGAIEAILGAMGTERVLYGSDFPVSHLRGRCVAVGDAFVWLTDDNAAFSQPMGHVKPTLVGLESLRVLKLACRSLGMGDSDVERIFFGNAAKLFDLSDRASAPNRGIAATSMAGRVRLILPPVIYGVPGVETNLYFDNVVLVQNPRNYSFEAVSDKGAQFEERWAITPEPEDIGDHPIEVIVRDEANRVVGRGGGLVRVIAKNRSSRSPLTVLLVGDSLTAQGVYAQKLLELNERDGCLGLRLIGSRPRESVNTMSDLRHEGHSGWKAESFTTAVDPGDLSPFVYEAEQGKPRLDFGRYCKRFNDDRPPAAIVIYLGTNDVFGETDATIEACMDEVLKHYDTLIGEFRRVGAETRIGVVLPTPPSRSQDGFRNYTGAERQTRSQYRRNQHRAVERIVERYGRQEAERLYLIPAYLNLNSERHFPTALMPHDAEPVGNVQRVTDGVHPTEEGFSYIAESIYCWLKAVGAVA